MKIVLLSYGTRGDLQPLLALTLGLKEAGHDVVVAAQPDDALWAASYGCTFIPLGSRLKEFYEGLGTLSLRNLPTLNSLFLFLQNEIMIQFSQLLEICKGADLILATGAVYGAPSIAEYTRIPYCFISLCPQAIPSKAHPFWAFPFTNLPPLLNRLTWRVGDFFTNLCLKRTIDRGRAALGLTPSNGGWNYLLGKKIIVSTDEILGSVPQDVEIEHAQLGYLHLHQKGALSADLERFIDAGSPPVYIGFGSMPGQNSFQMMNVFLNASRQSGHRLIFTDKWAHVVNEEKTKNCFFIGNVPHPLLFPRLAAVVHHGGAGTTATAARAGVPQIVVPHFWDQFYWANQVFAKGIGPKPLGRSKLSTENLATALLTCTKRPILENAHAIREHLLRQDSLSSTVHYLEQTYVS